MTEAPEEEPETEAESASTETEDADAASEAEETASSEETETASSSAETEEAAPGDEQEEGRYFVLTYMSDGETEYTGDILKRMGLGSMLLRDDGTGTLTLSGDDPEDITWNDTEIMTSGQVIPYTLTDGVIHMENEEMGMVIEFTEGSPDDAEPAPLAPGDYDPDTMAGYYKISTVENDGEVTDTSIMEAIGMTMFLVLYEDGTGVLDLLDMPMSVAWSEDSFALEGAPIDITYDAGAITLDVEGSKMTFVYAGTPDQAPPIEAEE